jgi:PKD repeat protein
LPGNLQFTPGPNGTATISGMLAAGTGGTYHLKLKATNSAGSVTQNFTLTVDQAAAITSAATWTVKTGTASTFKITSTGNPTPTVALSGTLPGGLGFKAAANGTATITGTPSATDSGTYTVRLTATNGVGTPAVQTLVITVQQRPTFTSTTAATGTAGQPFTFKVTTSGNPAATLSESGTLPGNLQFTPGPNGTATISGTLAAGTAGTYRVKLKATNAAGSVTQTFTLTVLK